MDATNRTVLSLLGLLLVAAGVAAVLVMTGVLAAAQPGDWYTRVADGITSQPWLWWTIILAALVLLAVLALVWASRQLVVRRPGGALDRIPLDRGPRGTTRVEAAALARAVRRDLRRIPGVSDVTTRIVGSADAPRVRATLDTLVLGDLSAVRTQAEEANARARQALGLDDLPMHLRLRPVADSSSRVR